MLRFLIILLTLRFSIASASGMTLSSSDIQANAMIAPRFTCSGANIPPHLAWSGVPRQARELALTLFDPDARRGAGYVHWVLYHMSPKAASTSDLQGSLSGLTNAGTGYHGACPPLGDKPHHYIFTLYALDSEMSTGKRMTYAMLQDSMRGHVLAKAELIGLYKR
jgi:hypothetical protein